MEPSFEKLLVVLAETGVRFVIVGGIAVTLQGYVRLTEDIDLLLDDEPANIRRLLRTLSDYGEGYARELSEEDFDDSEGAIRIVEETEQCQIDLFSLRGHQIPYASKASLIGWKSRSVREKDRLDVLALRRLTENPHAFD